MKTSEKLISALLTILLGVLFMVMKSDVVRVAMTILGIALIVIGILNLVDKYVAPAVVKIVLGALIVLCGWRIVEAVLYIVAALLLIYGILDLYMRSKAGIKVVNFNSLLFYAKPILMILLAILLFFNKLNGIFIVAGICAVLEGALMLVDAVKKD